MVLTPLAPAGPTDTAEQLQQAVRLGHVLGNQHWPIAVVGGQILVPVSLDRTVMETVVTTHHMTDYFQIQYERRPWPQDKKIKKISTSRTLSQSYPLRRMDDTALLAALQLADSFFPSGTLTLSHGLEAFLSLHPESAKTSRVYSKIIFSIKSCRSSWLPICTPIEQPKQPILSTSSILTAI